MPLSRRTTYNIGLIQAQAYRNLQALFRSALEEFKLTIPEWTLLGLVYEHNAMSLKELTESMKSKASHPTILVNQLAARGLVERTASPLDQRMKQVRLTSAGRDLVVQAEGKVKQTIITALSGVDREVLERYFTVLLAISQL